MSTVTFTDPADPLFDSGTGAARNLMLDPETGDRLVVAGQQVLVRGVPSIAQAVRRRLLTFKGEWFLDTTLGLPYLQEVLTKGTPASRLRSIFRDAILEVPGISEVTKLEPAYNPTTRRLTVTWTATTDTGALVGTTVEIPA